MTAEAGHATIISQDAVPHEASERNTHPEGLGVSLSHHCPGL